MSAAKTPNNEGSVYQRASDGKWCAAVTLPSGRRKIAYGATEKEAIRERRKMLARVEAGKPSPAGRTPTLGAYLTRWLDVRIAGEVEAGHLDESTADSYRQIVEGHILPCAIARVKVNALSPDDVRSWQRERLKTTSSRGKPFSPRTVGMAHAALRRALNDAMRDEVLTRNIAALVKLPSGQSKPVDAPTEQDLEKVFVEMMTDDLDVLWFTMLAFGPRRGEALAMRWSLTNLEAGTTKLRKQLRRVRGDVDQATGRRRGRLVEKDLKAKRQPRVVGPVRPCRRDGRAAARPPARRGLPRLRRGCQHQGSSVDAPAHSRVDDERPLRPCLRECPPRYRGSDGRRAASDRKYVVTGLLHPLLHSDLVTQSPGEFALVKCGAPEGIRTPNLLIRSQMLYPLSYGRGCPAIVPGRLARRLRDSNPGGALGPQPH
jgi:integrase